MNANLIAFERLLTIMNELRERCPWDRKQTIQSLRKLTIEETYELSDAINREDWQNIKEELGDLFLHLVFYSKIGEEQQQFTISEVLNSVCDKLIHRHPHVYGDITVTDEEEVKKNWEQLKLKEGKKSVLAGVPSGLPAINKAQRIQEKVKAVGFDFEQRGDAWHKVEEELQELKQAQTILEQEEEFGDVLFALINYSRFIAVDAEACLEKSNQKFISRFNFMEQEARSKNILLNELSLEELDTLWNKAKAEE